MREVIEIVQKLPYLWETLPSKKQHYHHVIVFDNKSKPDGA